MQYSAATRGTISEIGTVDKFAYYLRYTMATLLVVFHDERKAIA